MKKKLFCCLFTICSVCYCFADEPFYQSYIELSGRATSLVNNDFGSGADVSLPAGGVALEFVNGCRINKYVFVGGGLGISSLFSRQIKVSMGGVDLKIPYYLEQIVTPLYADFRASLPLKQNQRVTPYAEVAVGPLFSYNEYEECEYSQLNINIKKYGDFYTAAYFKTGLGIDVIDRFTLGIGYEMWGDKNAQYHFGYLKLGVKIGISKGKY